MALTVQGADAADTTTTSVETLIEAAEQIETVMPDSEGPSTWSPIGYYRNQLD